MSQLLRWKVKGKTILGLTEPVTLLGSERLALYARVDSGATYSSIDAGLAKKLGWQELKRTRKVSSSHGVSVRTIVQGDIILAGKSHGTEFTVADRSHLKYLVLIGQNTLKGNNYLIDPDKH